MFDISEELKKLPQKPGVYIMKDSDQKIIYIGKAISLKNRVRQYFQSAASQIPKVRNMVAHISEFEYIVTDNELEALILECNLIKKHKPKYNIMLKDDKSYPYLKITLNESFPRVFLSRRHEKDKAKYFGPYTSVLALRETIELIHNLWPIRRCFKKFPRDIGKGRPCLNYHIGRCKAPCTGNLSEPDYNQIINEVIQFVNGKHDNILKKLETEMALLSENLEFEKAAEIRDKINSLHMLEEKQKIDSGPNSDQDVIAFARGSDEALVQVFFIRSGKMVGREHFMLNMVDGVERGEIMAGFIKQFYSETSYIPKELLLETDIQEREIVSQWLSKLKGQNVNIIVPQKGEKHKLVQMAYNNAIIALEQFSEQIKRERQRTLGALDEIKNALKLDIDLERIEAYDISNIQGYESVGSMVVFENGKPKSRDYRKFKIKSVIGPDDYASMEEVIQRRFLRYLNGDDDKFSTLPSIIMIDGGKGQIHSAEKILRQLCINIPVCGMIKDDRHRTRGLMYQNEEISMPYTSEGFKLVTRIQDEVHRFAIEYHRKLREKSSLHSVLDDINGIGPARRKALLKHFGNIESIKKAEINELLQVKEMSNRAAESVYNFFRDL